MSVQVDGREVTLTSLDRVLYPETGFTKGDLVGYYHAIAPLLVPHLAGRPLTLGRFPSGVDGRGFAQTECRGAPPWVATRPLPLRDGRIRNFCLVNDTPSLLWVANLGTIELHPFLSAGDRPDEPTVVVFDLDPGTGAAFQECCETALALRELLAESGLASFPKTSGGAGLHVYVPLNSPHTFEETKRFARLVAEQLADGRPDQVTAKASKQERWGKVLVDWVQNDVSRSTVSVYSLRAARWPLVSTPLAWDEVERREAVAFGPDAALERVERLGDLFAPILELEQRLPAQYGRTAPT
jgi:bifunctional non-homologous end joining protein LigD